MSGDARVEQDMIELRAAYQAALKKFRKNGGKELPIQEIVTILINLHNASVQFIPALEQRLEAAETELDAMRGDAGAEGRAT